MYRAYAEILAFFLTAQTEKKQGSMAMSTHDSIVHEAESNLEEEQAQLLECLL